MKNFQRGSLRDRTILEALERLSVLTTEQVRLLFFHGLSQDRLICQRRMKRLFERGHVKRGRFSANEPYFYYIDKKPKQLEHRLGVNWVYVRETLKWRRIPDYKLSYPVFEDTYRNMRPDAFFAVKNTFKKENLFYFVEFDIAERGNEFNKVQLYNSLYENNEIAGRWWYKYATGFPTVIIVTTGRIERILKHKEAENRHGLEFQVHNFDDLKGECLHGRNYVHDSQKSALGR